MAASHYGRLAVMTALSFIAMYALMYAMVNAMANVYMNLSGGERVLEVDVDERCQIALLVASAHLPRELRRHGQIRGGKGGLVIEHDRAADIAAAPNFGGERDVT
jgi:hypothetical protein